MEAAIQAVGEEFATSRIMYLGKDGHVLTFPVAHGKIMNVVAFHYDPEEWSSEQLVVPTTQKEAKRDFINWGYNVKAIIDLFKDNLDKWGIFDLGDNPMSQYNKGRICVAGDAAHATGPHHGAGAGFCIEDSAVLAELLVTAWTILRRETETKSTANILELALSVYDNARRERTQWLVDSSRICGDLYDWRSTCGKDPSKIKEDLLWRSHKIWDVDLEAMTKKAQRELESLSLDV